jgi:hypothetical protein
METYAKQMIDFQKTTFDNAFNTIANLQDQAEKMTFDVIEQLPWMSQEGKKALDDSAKMFKEARANYKSAVNDGFSKMEELLVQ